MDLTQSLLTPLRENNAIGTISPEFIQPAYADQSIQNIPATICRLLDIPVCHASPLRPDILSQIDDEFRTIILVLVDALSLHLFQRWMREGKTPVWKNLLERGLLAPITSVVPSTTSSAITTLWTGYSPLEHGVIGYELWLREYGVVTNMITQSPMTFKGVKSSIQQAGFDPENALTVPTLGEHFSKYGVRTTSLQPSLISQSGLSKTFMKQVNLSGYASEADLWVRLREVIDLQPTEKHFVWVYSGTFDGLSHRFGPEDERVELEFINFSRNFEHNFMNRLNCSQKERTLFILTADHGQIHTPHNPHFSLTHHPDFLNALHIKPTGEHRFSYLHVRPGKENFIRDYVHQTWPEQFYIFESSELYERGLLGSGKPDWRTEARMGDLTIIARENSYLWWADEKNELLGRHGGLTSEEMLVPFLASPL